MKSGEDGIVWLGHASLFLRLGNIRLLIDPVFGSPTRLMRRYSDLPFKPEALKGIDLLMLSHDHRDHADEDSLRFLRRINPVMQVLTSLGMADLIRPWTPGLMAQEAGWFQRYASQNHDLEIWFLPTRHWGGDEGCWPIPIADFGVRF